MSAMTPLRVLIVSNRLPVTVTGDEVHGRLRRSAGGLATALSGVSTARRLWIGWTGAPTAGAVPAGVVERLARHRLAPVPLSPTDVAQYYDGFANGVLWPVFHYMIDRIPANSGDWHRYREVNERFAAETVRQWRPGDVVWIHDYHLMLVPALVRERLPHAQIGFFLHIPFPAPDVFQTLPWRADLVQGLLGADVIGFHTDAYCRHFEAAAHRLLGAPVSEGRVAWHGRSVQVDAFPIGVDVTRFERLASRPDVARRTEAIRAGLAGQRLLLGVDRLDYTKGIIRRLLAFQRLLEREPSCRQSVRFVQIAVPSRIDVQAYRRYRRELDELVSRINGTYGTVADVPVHYVARNVPAHELVALYRAADVMVVTPLRDGMNLVCKEFVAARTDGDGALILSEFAGAAEELRDAAHVNPYDIDAVSDAMKDALHASESERRRRMRSMRETVVSQSAERWAAAFLERAAAVPARPTPLQRAVAAARADTDRRLALLLDYDGTLVPIAPTPAQSTPDPALLNLLSALGARPGIDLHLVTGRSIESVNTWFWHLRATLWAEHGAAWRPREGGDWQRKTGIGRRDLEPIIALMEAASGRTPGAITEVKATAAAWHYRLVDPELIESRLPQLRSELARALAGSPFELLSGRMVLEVRPRGASKGAVVSSIREQAAPDTLFIAIGDDRTDEEMFAALPPDSLAIHVGPGPSSARHSLATPDDVRSFLGQLAARNTRRGGRFRIPVVPMPALPNEVLAKAGFRPAGSAAALCRGEP